MLARTRLPLRLSMNIIRMLLPTIRTFLRRGGTILERKKVHRRFKHTGRLLITLRLAHISILPLGHVSVMLLPHLSYCSVKSFCGRCDPSLPGCQVRKLPMMRAQHLWECGRHDLPGP